MCDTLLFTRTAHTHACTHTHTDTRVHSTCHSHTAHIHAHTHRHACAQHVTPLAHNTHAHSLTCMCTARATHTQHTYTHTLIDTCVHSMCLHSHTTQCTFTDTHVHSTCHSHTAHIHAHTHPCTLTLHSHTRFHPKMHQILAAPLCVSSESRSPLRVRPFHRPFEAACAHSSSPRTSPFPLGAPANLLRSPSG